MSQRAAASLTPRHLGYAIVCVMAPIVATLIVTAVANVQPKRSAPVVVPPTPAELESLRREGSPHNQSASHTNQPPLEKHTVEQLRHQLQRHLVALKKLQADIDHVVASAGTQSPSETAEFSREIDRRVAALIAASPTRRLEPGPVWEAICNAESEIRQSWFDYTFRGRNGYLTWKSRADLSLAAAKKLLDASASDTSS